MVIRPTFKRQKQFRDGAIAFQKEKCGINLNKAIYIRTSILDLSKALMQHFHNNYVKTKYCDKAEMLLTGTNSVKLRLKMFMKTSTKIKSHLTSAITKKVQNITIMQIA